LKKIIALALLASTSAIAQEAPKPTEPTEAKAAPAAPPKFVLEFDSADINVLNQCVGDMAFKVAQPFVAKINAQMAPQLAKMPKAN
jgi:hypothetical protein